MLRAKFKTPEKQREFFIQVKNKLGIGAKELSKKLNLKSRGAIENYTFMRTSPPVEIIKKWVINKQVRKLKQITFQ